MLGVKVKRKRIKELEKKVDLLNLQLESREKLITELNSQINMQQKMICEIKAENIFKSDRIEKLENNIELRMKLYNELAQENENIYKLYKKQKEGKKYVRRK